MTPLEEHLAWSVWLGIALLLGVFDLLYRGRRRRG
jgi:hypothetical protein